MAFIPLQFPPGFYRNGTNYESKGRFFDGNLVRWFEGSLQPVGGWQRVVALNGTPVSVGVPVRGMLGWKDDNGIAQLALGSFCKAFAFQLGVLYDITPAGGIGCGTADATITSGGAYGEGDYGAGPYGGVVSEATHEIVEAGSWQFDTFGQDLIGNPFPDGGIYEWDPDNPATRMTAISGAPTANAIVTTPERVLVALGADGDRRLIRWSDQDVRTDWTDSPENFAGDFPLPGAGDILAGRRGRDETLIWTETDLWAMRFVGGDAIYKVQQVGANCGAISRHAMATFGSRAIWMGRRGFYGYDGYVQPIPSEVGDYVFSDMNTIQRSKIVAIPRSEYGEVTWHYPSANSVENDRYVTYNFHYNIWYFGELERTAGIDRGSHQFPISADADGNLYEHERGTDMLIEGRRVTALRLPGEAGDYASTSDSAALDVAVDLDIRGAVTLAAVPLANETALVEKLEGASNSGYRLTVRTDGAVRLYWGDGTAVQFAASTATLTLTVDETLLVRAVLDADDGAGGHTVTIYAKQDVAAEDVAEELQSDHGWTQLGSVVQDPGGAGTTSIAANTVDLELGAAVGGTIRLLDGDIYAAMVIAGTDVASGNTVFDVDFTTLEPGATSVIEPGSGAEVTVNQSGDPEAEIVEVSTAATSEAVPFAETGPIELGNGDQILTVLYVIPDEDTVGDVDGTLTFRLFPTSTPTVTGPFTLSEQTSVRATGRQVRLKLRQVNPGWRVGNFRLDVRPGGRR